jgi:two-component sensor histidine kinase
MRTVIAQEVGSFDSGGAISTGGPRLRLNPRSALAIALVIHELGTNASKYGALSVPGGKVAVTWQAEGGSEPAITLRWEESGGPGVSPPTSTGFGSMLIENSIAYELEGRTQLDYRREGLVCVIWMPLRMVRPFVDERVEPGELA